MGFGTQKLINYFSPRRCNVLRNSTILTHFCLKTKGIFNENPNFALWILTYRNLGFLSFDLLRQFEADDFFLYFLLFDLSTEASKIQQHFRTFADFGILNLVVRPSRRKIFVFVTKLCRKKRKKYLRSPENVLWHSTFGDSALWEYGFIKIRSFRVPFEHSVFHSRRSIF